MIVEVFISGGKAQDALGDEFGQRMLDETLIAHVLKTGSKTAGEPQGRVELAQQKQTAVGAEMAAGEIRDDLPGAEILEIKQLGTGGGRKSLRGHTS
jgi:hypothetical protein